MKMKVALALFTLLPCHTLAKKHKPHRISYKDLLKNEKATQDSFMEALSEVGLVSITDIPSYEESKKNALNWIFHECTEDSESSMSFKYDDGTVRRTLATHTIPGPGKLHHFDF